MKAVGRPWTARPAGALIRATVTLSDQSTDVSVAGTNVAASGFSTTIGGGSGSESISETANRGVQVDEACTPQGSAIVTNTAHLDGTSSSVTVQVGTCSNDLTKSCQVDTDCGTGNTCQITGYTFACVTGVDLDTSANAAVSCEVPPPTTPNACTYTKGGYASPGVPGQIFDSNYLTTFTSGLTIGIADGTGPKHDATWNATTIGRNALKTYVNSNTTGPSTALNADSVDTTSTNGGQLPRQTATLTLNVGFGIKLVNNVPTVDTSGFGALQLCHLAEGSTIGSFTLTAAQAAALNGKTVSQILADANNALGGNGLPLSYVGSFGDLNELVTALNESFDNCNASTFASANLCVAP